MKLFISNLFQKIVSVGLTLAFVLSLVPFMGVQEVGAVDEVKIVVGNHIEAQPTNMMIQYQLQADFEPGETITVLLDLGHNTLFMHNDCSDIRFEVDTDDAVNDDDGSEYKTGLSANGSSCYFYRVAFEGLNRIDLTLGGSEPTIAAGEYLRFFIGPDDGYDLYNGGTPGNGYDIVSGVDDNHDDFAGAAATTVGAGSVQALFIYSSSATSEVLITEDSGETALGAFAVNDDTNSAEELVLNYTFAEYINLTINDAILDFGNFSLTEMGRDTAVVEVETNASLGYNLRYRSTEFTNGSNTVDRKSIKGALSGGGNGEWGINLAANTLGGNEGSVPYLTTAGKGTDPSNMAAANYNTADNYYLGAVNTLDEIIANPNPTGDTITITGAVMGATMLSAGNYEATLTLNVYANF